MELEKQVVSLELAKKMKELGFEQNSYCYWCIEPKGFKNRGWYLGTTNDRKYSAYTVAELFALFGNIQIRLEDSPSNDGNWFIKKGSYKREDGWFTMGGWYGEPQNVLSKMLIYLKEQPDMDEIIGGITW